MSNTAKTNAFSARTLSIPYLRALERRAEVELRVVVLLHERAQLLDKDIVALWHILGPPLAATLHRGVRIVDHKLAADIDKFMRAVERGAFSL